MEPKDTDTLTGGIFKPFAISSLITSFILFIIIIYLNGDFPYSSAIVLDIFILLVIFSGTFMAYLGIAYIIIKTYFKIHSHFRGYEKTKETNHWFHFILLFLYFALISIILISIPILRSEKLEVLSFIVVFILPFGFAILNLLISNIYISIIKR